MRRITAFILSIVILLSSSIGFAAPGDFIHTGLKKGYNMKSADDRAALIRDLKDGKVDKKLFYREIEGGKYINIAEEEKEQERKLLELLAGKVNTSDPNAIEAFLRDPKNSKIVQDIGTQLEKVTTDNSVKFGEIVDENKGYIEDYFKDMYAQRLQTPGNYSMPVPGYKDNTTKIVNLTFPSNSGASKWVVKVAVEAFESFKLNEVVNDGRTYNPGTDIEASIGKHLLLAAVDSNSRVKAYASIEIKAEMVKAPKVPANKDGSVTNGMNLAPGEKHSGATKVSGLSDGLKIAVLDTEPATVYETDKFNSVLYKDGIELIVASDAELDNMSNEFKKYIIVYSEIGGKIENYNIIPVTSDNVSGAFDADKLIQKADGVDKYNYSLPVKGNSAGTTKIEELFGLEDFAATKWMYIVGTDLTSPKLDRVVKDSIDYVAGEDIKIGIGQDLMLLATDNNGRVRAYGIVKEITGERIKNPLAEELKETTHFTKPVKGTQEGTTKFGFLNHKDAKIWKYVVSDEVILAPELNSTDIDYTGDISEGTDIKVEDSSNKLKAENGFRKYMMVYGLDGNEVKVFKSFVMNDTNVRMPGADGLKIDKNYSGLGELNGNLSSPVKGNAPNTTRIAKLAHTGLSSTAFRYKVIDESSMEIEFNQVIDGIRELRPNVDIPTTVGKNLLILAVDSSNKTKAYTIVPLVFENVKAGNAPPLQPMTNYQGPVPGDGNESTKFTFLSLPSGATKWAYKVANTSFGIPETGAVVSIGTGDEDYKGYTPSDTDPKNTVYPDMGNVNVGKHLLLVAVDKDNKVIAYREFPLKENEVKGNTLDPLNSKAYSLTKGDNPSTTKLKLEPLGLENPSSIVWRYKLVDGIPSDNKDKPYLNQIIPDAKTYSVNSNTKTGPDIAVTKVNDSYGYILLLATDYTGRTKSYVYIPINANDVKEHATEIMNTENNGLSLKHGIDIDSVNFDKLPAIDGNPSYKYLISNTKPATPAVGDTLPSGVVDYTGSDIVIQIGRYLTLYKVDANNKIVAYKTLQVSSVKQGSATLSGDTFLEGSIKNGGSSFTVTLSEGAKWSDIVNDKSIRDKLFNGFKADSEATEWSKVISSMIADGKGAISKVDDTTITILLPQTLNYDIKEDQKISLVIPPEAIVGAINPINAKGNITIKPTIGANISGYVVSSIVRQSDIKSGGKTIVIELTDGTWSTNVSGIIDWFSGGNNWDLIKSAFTPEVKSKNIMRNSGTKVTITLPPVTGVKFGTTKEVISLTIPKDSGLIDGATEEVIASPSFTLYPDILTVVGEAVEGKNKVTLMAPDYRVVDTKSDTWQIKVTTGTLKDAISNNDVIISGLPRGLVATVSKVEKDTIEIKVSGTASATMASDTVVKVKVKGTAITEPNSVDSSEIELMLVRGESMMGELEKVKVDVLNGMLMEILEDNSSIQLNSSNIEFSLDSTNGINGDNWITATEDKTKNIEFKPGKVYVREKANIKVFREVANLTQPKAPVGIAVSEVGYDGADMKVKLNIQDSTYDYSNDGGNKWIKLDPNNELILSSNSDLRVRIRATESNLASLPTAKIAILDLREVKMNVKDGELLGTTTSMEYSVNSGISFTAAKAPNTSVVFVKDEKVIIREKGKPFNEHIIGNVGIVLTPSKDNISFDILAGNIKDTEKRGLQYRIGSESWKDLSPSNEETSVTFKQGKLEIRAKGDDNNLPSEPVELATIASPAAAPTITTNDFTKDIYYWNGTTELPLQDPSLKGTLEYSINDGSPKDNTEWGNDKITDLIKNGNPKINIRFKAKPDTLPSLAKTVNFTGNLTFENVKLNVVEGKIDGTTTAMQYSIDSMDGLNGTWIDAKANSTPVEFVQGMIVYIREKSKPLNKIPLTIVENEINKGIGVELPLSENDFDYSIADGSITNKSLDMIEYRFDDDKWATINRAKSTNEPTIIYGVQFNPGSLQFRRRGTANTLPSSVFSIPIKAKTSAPQLKYDNVKYIIEKIGSSEGEKYEYSINGSPWITGNIDTQFEGGNVVLIRLKAEDKQLPSSEQKITFTSNLTLGNVIINAGKLQLENTSTLMEYSIDSTNGEDGLWFPCTAPNTSISLKENMVIYIRENAKPRNWRKLTKDTDPIKERDFPNGDNIVKDNLDYDILEKTISIKNITSENKEPLQSIVNNLQYRIGNGNWTNVDYVTLDIDKTKVLAFNINFVTGNLEFRLRGDEKTLPSKNIFKGVIKAPASAPDVSKGFEIDDINNKYRNSVNYGNTVDKKKLEYSFGENGPWINGEHLDTEELVGNVYIRVRANKDTLPSLVKTLEFTPVLNLKTVILSTYVKPLELNGTTTQMQYRVNYGVWQDCSDGNTKLKRNDKKTDLNDINDINIIEIHDKNQPDNFVTVYPKP